ncbi:hypothetical protein RDWZM_007688 [Blomia tropicalis]|uniref:Phospholipase A2 n=1 Tax=Blomia tropicalis TaxID=40697 RepID=A0A9Q0RJC1_BLOTA|nr:hypothetical protein RDWZM_007688 [Blomia tropicalis]
MFHLYRQSTKGLNFTYKSILIYLYLLLAFQYPNFLLECRHISNETNIPDSFARVYTLPDGEIVTKLKWNNFTAIETRFSNIDLIQIIKESHVIQLWLSRGELVDCEYTDDKHKVQLIRNEFAKINPNMRKDSRVFTLVENYNNLTTLPKPLKRLTEYEQFVEQCSKLHTTLRSKYEKNRTQKNRNGRIKRNLLVFPGTNWCGQGSNSQNFEDLGEYTFADRCCRDHDRCKYSIGPFDTRYHLFNYRFHFVSHCSCDERFRSCLKVANSGAANLVGKIFFNVVQTKCFMFQMDEICQDRSWWGTCVTSKRRKRAVFRDPMTY